MSSPPEASAPVSDASTPAGGEAGAATAAVDEVTVPSGGKKGRRRRKQAAAGGSSPAAAPEAQKLTHLVIDSGAIIKGAGITLASAAEVRRRVCLCVCVFRVLVVVGAC